MDVKRLFFGLPAFCKWPQSLPEGRIVKEENRHLTLSFLGSCDWEKMQKLLVNFPGFQRKVGAASLFSQALFLPINHPQVVAWKVQENSFFYQKIKNELDNWLKKQNCKQDQKPFLPHVTIARFPFPRDPWQKHFINLGVQFHELHVYESFSFSEYRSLWKWNFLPPFEEISHIADRAFIIRGENIQEIYEHAKIALFFDDPLYFPYVEFQKKVTSLDETVIALNDLIALCDKKIGSIYKAVSFAGELKKENSVYSWEMIVDV